VRDRQVDVHLVAASHQNLPQHVQEKKFRGDLYFRVSTIPLRMPSLRERPEDIPILGRQIFQGFANDLGRRGLELSHEAERALCGYSWPGNVRELRNVLERALLLCNHDILQPEDLRFEGPGATSLPLETGSTEMHLTLEELEKVHIERVLREMGGRVAEASQRLGIPRSTLYQRIKKFSISLPRIS
jgi:DNA-binding NtrC family response regulator